MKMDVTKLEDDKLLDIWKIATEWTTNRMQVSGTNKNRMGDPHTIIDFVLALDKIEKIENELYKRGLPYGRK